MFSPRLSLPALSTTVLAAVFLSTAPHPAQAASFAECNQRCVRAFKSGDKSGAQRLGEISLSEARKTAPNLDVTIALYNLCSIAIDRDLRSQVGLYIDQLVDNEKALAGGFTPAMVPALERATRWAERAQLWTKAIDLRKRIYAIELATHGADHINTIESLEALAKTLELSDQHREAVKIWQRLSAKANAIDHFNYTLRLSACLANLGNMQAALSVLPQVNAPARTSRQSRKLANLELLITLQKANLLARLDEPDQSEHLMRQAITRLRCGKHNAVLADVVVKQLTTIADYYVEKKQFARAEKMFATLCALVPELPARSQAAGTVVVHYDALLRRQGKVDQANQLEDVWLEKFGMPLLHNTMLQLQSAGAFQAEAVLCQRGIDKSRELGNDFLVAINQRQLAHCLTMLRDYRRALVVARPALNHLKLNWGRSYPRELLTLLTDIQKCQYKLGMNQQANQTHAELMRIMTSTREASLIEGCQDEWRKLRSEPRAPN